MRTIITTVGTSVFTNYQEEHEDINDKIEDLKSKPYNEWKNCKDDTKSIKKTIHRWLTSNNKSSAEIKSISELKKKYGKVSVQLIATDTILSVLAADILKEYFMQENQENVEVIFDKDNNVIIGLQVENKDRFVKVGLITLIERLNSLMGTSYEDMIFNITGGYKALIPYMTIMGQIYNIPICYIFEETDELIEIPQVPVDFDFSVIEENYYAFQTLRKDKPPNVEDSKKDFGDGIFNRLKNENLIEETDEEVKLTPLGNMLMKRYEDLFNSGKYHKQNLISNLIELKLFKYFVEKCGNKASVEHGKKIGDENYDIDIYMENEDTITAIEVKSGGNVPIWNVKGKKESIEYKLTEGGFKHLIDEHKGKKLKLEVFLYHPKSIHPSVIGQIDELCKKFPLETKFLKWFCLKIHRNYSANTHWNVTDNDIQGL